MNESKKKIKLIFIKNHHNDDDELQIDHSQFSQSIHSFIHSFWIITVTKNIRFHHQEEEVQRTNINDHQ